MIELKVKIRSDDLTLTENYLLYESITLTHDDPKLKDLVEKTLEKFQGSKEDIDIVVKAKLTW